MELESDFEIDVVRGVTVAPREVRKNRTANKTKRGNKNKGFRRQRAACKKAQASFLQGTIASAFMPGPETSHRHS
jgi:hypothetical protein